MTILIVDDSPVDAKVAQAMIAREGVTADFLFARSGEESITIAQKQRLDIIIMDVLMPGMQGFEAASKIKDLQPDAKIIILTNAEETIHPDKVRASRVDYYTSKKLMDYTLKAAIQKILTQKKNEF
jgi:CheY-like chemotaxis protein